MGSRRSLTLTDVECKWEVEIYTEGSNKVSLMNQTESTVSKISTLSFIHGLSKATERTLCGLGLPSTTHPVDFVVIQQGPSARTLPSSEVIEGLFLGRAGALVTKTLSESDVRALDVGSSTGLMTSLTVSADIRRDGDREGSGDVWGLSWGHRPTPEYVPGQGGT